MLVRPNKRKAQERQRRHRRSKKDSLFEVFNVSADGKTLLGMSSGEPSSSGHTTLKGLSNDGANRNQKAVNIVEWRIHGDRVSTLNTLASVESDSSCSTKDSEAPTSITNNDPTTLALPSTSESSHLFLEQMFDDVVHQYGDLQDETPDMQLDKEIQNQRVCRLFLSQLAFSFY